MLEHLTGINSFLRITDTEVPLPLPLPIISMKSASLQRLIDTYMTDNARRKAAIKYSSVGWKAGSYNGQPIDMELAIEVYKSDREQLALGFDTDTDRFTLDIDAGSIYHPDRVDSELDDLLDKLHAANIEGYIPVRSSNSGGVHLIFPVPDKVKSKTLGARITSYLKKRQIVVMDGTLEVYPNKVTYVKSDNPKDWSRCKQVRLPLQAGSFILDRDFQPFTNSLDVFWEYWDECVEINSEFDIDSSFEVSAADKDRVSPKVAELKFESYVRTKPGYWRKGWTGESQTNSILMSLGFSITGYNDVQHLGNLIFKRSARLPGFDAYCREFQESEKEFKKHCQRVAKYYDRKRRGVVKDFDRRSPDEIIKSNKAKIRYAINSLKKSGKKINYSNIAQVTNIERQTVSKYLNIKKGKITKWLR